MWVAAGVVWQLEGDWSAGELDEGEGGFGAVEAIGAADEEPHLVVEAFVAAVGQSPLDRGVDTGTVFADRACGFDELRDAAALGAGAPAVEQVGQGGGVEVTGEDLAQGLLELVGAPEDPAR